jgi:hypothetical protein
MPGRRRLRCTAAAAVTLVVAAAQTASAGANLPSGAPVTGTVTTQYQYTASYGYWSVTAVVPTATSDFDLYLYDKNNSLLTSSTYGTGITDFAAVDSNSGTRTLPQVYNPQVKQYSPGQYWVEAQYGATEVTIPAATHHGTTGFADPDIAFLSLNSNHVVSIADIYLTAGQSFWATTPSAASQMYLLEADTANPSTFVQNRVQATIRDHTQVVDNCTRYTATTTGWHALVLVDDTPPATTSPQQGIAYGLHAYDASQPDYCPMSGFPGPTP